MKNQLLCSMVLLLTGISSLASTVEFSSINLQGRGCPESASSVVLSPDRQRASILFDTLSVEVPFSGFDELTTSFEKLIDRKVCNIKVSLNVPADEVITAVEFQNDIRGVAIVDRGAEAEFDSRIISWSDSVGRSKTQSAIIENILFKGGSDEELLISNETVIGVDSSCGANRSGQVDFVLRNFIRAEVVNKYISPTPTALLVVDSSDLAARLNIKLHTRKCFAQIPTRPTRPTRGDRRDQVDRQKIEICRNVGGVWDERSNTCKGQRRYR